MAETTLFVRGRLAQIESIVLDASESESHVGEMDVTEYPVESGSDITDHAREKPDRVTITGVISNTPTNRARADQIAAAFGNADLSVVNDGTVGGSGTGFAESMIERLHTLRKKAVLLTVVTARRRYASMICESVTEPVDKKTGDGVRFTATFKRARIVQNKNTTIVVAKSPKARAVVNLGVKNLPEASGSVTGGPISTIQDIRKNGIGGWLKHVRE